MLNVRDLSYSYNGTAVLNGLDLTAQKGEMVGVVGPNGAGKTTLLRLISGILKPPPGGITIGGTDVSTLSARERAKLVAVVPQGPTLPVGFSVLDLVLMGRNPHLKLFQWESAADLEIAARSMEKTQILALADRAVGTLSGGEKQRAVIAMALSQETPVLLLDEPTSNLDLAHQTQVMDTVRDVHRDGEGVVVIAMHDLTLAAQYCDRLVMLSGGQVYVSGRPGEVLNEATISEVYGTEAIVMSHPETGTPVVLATSSANREPNETRSEE